MNYEVFLKLQNDSNPNNDPFAGGRGVSIARYLHLFPYFEMWQIEEVLGNNRYHIKRGTKKQRFVRSINSDPVEYGAEDWVICGYYKGDRGRPFILAKGGLLFASPDLTDGQWPFHRHGLGRTSQTSWSEKPLTMVGSITKVWDFSVAEVRAWDGQIFLPFIGSVLKTAMGEHWPEFYDSVEDEYLLPHHQMPSNDLDECILDPEDEGSILAAGGGVLKRISRADMTEIWSAELEDIGTYLPGTLFSSGNVIGFLSSVENRLHLNTLAPDGSGLETKLLYQTKHPNGGFLPGEPVMMISGNSNISPGNGAGFVSYWDPADPDGHHNIPANPYGFLNSTAISAASFNAVIQNQRNYGRQASSMNPSEFHWGEPAEQYGVLQFASLDGVLVEDGVIIPKPPSQEFLPTLVAYTTTGNVLWEKLGWKHTQDQFPLQYRDFFCPVLIAGGKLVVIRLKLTFRTIDETFVFIIDEGGAWTGDPAGGSDYKPSLEYLGYTSGPERHYYEIIFTNIYKQGHETQFPPEERRSRRIVGVQTYQDVFELETGALLSSVALAPQVTSLFAVRGEFIGVFPPEHGFRALTSPFNPAITQNQLDHLGFAHVGHTLQDFWPVPSSYFTALFEEGKFYVSGLYAATNNRVPPPWLWPIWMAQPGYPDELFEPDPHYDPNNNNAYNRIEEPGSTWSHGYWGVKGDFDNSGSPDVRTEVAPPESFCYQAILHEYSYDLPHFSDWFNPVLNSDRSLIIAPPVQILGSTYVNQPLNGRKFAPSAGSDDYYSWSGGTVANRMAHSITVTHYDWQTDERQIWVARDWLGNITWKHFIEASELPGLIYNDPFFGPVPTHQFSRPCCSNGKMHIIHRVKDGPYRLRVVNDLTGELISDTALTMIEGHHEEGDNGGAPVELIMAGDVAVLTTQRDIVVEFSFDTFEFIEHEVGKPHVLALYPDS